MGTYRHAWLAQALSAHVHSYLQSTPQALPGLSKRCPVMPEDAQQSTQIQAPLEAPLAMGTQSGNVGWVGMEGTGKMPSEKGKDTDNTA